jgi:hypothetical protein
MAQILITHPEDIHIYTPIASIKKYNEPDFEEKLWRYAKSIFQHYYVFKFKYPLNCDDIPGKNFEPDLLLVSKTYKKWVLIEVELCKSPSTHTLDQVTCFSNPKINPKDVLNFLVVNNPGTKIDRKNFLDCFSNYTPDLIIVLDDYSDVVFKKFYEHKKQLKICVLEVYKKTGYLYEGFRFGGDYPYELTNSSKIDYVDEQHYKILKKDFLRDLPSNFELKFDMVPFDASLIKVSPKTTYLKLPNHNIPSDIYLQIGKTLDGEYVIQKL